jgi:hypothetical protein
MNDRWQLLPLWPGTPTGAKATAKPILDRLEQMMWTAVESETNLTR